MGKVGQATLHLLLMFLICLICLSGLVLPGCGSGHNRSDARVSGTKSDQTTALRVISTAPSITETLFAIGQGDHVVAVSNYCNYPPEAARLPRTGGLLDPNIEAIVELRPDIVFVLAESTVVRQRLTALGVRVVPVDHSTLPALIDSFETMGNCFGKETATRGLQLKNETLQKLNIIKTANRKGNPPRVLISIDRDRSLRTLSAVFAAGNNDWFNALLEAAGGKNAVPQTSPAVVSLSREGMMEINPDVIIDLSTDGDYSMSPQRQKEFRDSAIAVWNTLGPSVKAIRDNRVFVFPVDYATIPGPRTLRFIEELADIFRDRTNQPSSEQKTP